MHSIKSPSPFSTSLSSSSSSSSFSCVTLPINASCSSLCFVSPVAPPHSSTHHSSPLSSPDSADPSSRSSSPRHLGRLLLSRPSPPSRPLIANCALVRSCASSMAVELVSPEASPASTAVVKPPADKREYEVVHLPNGLCALLVHDPEIAGGEEEQSDDDDLDAEAEASEGDEYENGESGEDEEDEDEDEDEDDEEDEDDDDDEMVSPGLESVEKRLDGTCCQENGACSDHNHENMDNGGRRKVPGRAPTKKMAAAAMSVGVGSFCDPKDGQGLAHFLEHMLFMGSAKYPDENEYDTFLSKHGGSSNAFTETEHTCYFFEVNHKFLRPALDRFSQFFLSPLVKEEAMEREVQAVHSEFEEHLQSDAVRLSQLQCNTAHPLHPFNCFSWGNRKSLSEPAARGIDIRKKLLELYEDHYLSGRMKLCVIGGEQLETLKEWVLELFSGVRGGGQKKLMFSWEGPVWESGKMYRVKSVKDQHYLSVLWPLTCLDEAYLKKPHDYISHLLGHEGKGSLLSLLKFKGWATDLTAGTGEGGFDRCSAGYMFNVTIYLTDSGIGKVEDVVGLIYQYLKMLRETGPQEWVFKELQAMANMEFRFAEEEHPDDYAVSLATNMHLYPEQHIIYGEYAFEEWDPNLVKRLLACLVPQNMRLDLVTKSFDTDVPGISYEPWFGVPYTVENTSSMMDSWASPPSVDPMLHMPVVNEFIPHDFSLREGKGDYDDVPRILMDDSFVKVWYKLDQKFKMPRANVYFLITCKGAYDSIEASVLMELYARLMKDTLNETLYLARVARLETSLSVSVDRLEIKIRGFNEKLATLASTISHILKSFVPSGDRFQVIKEELERDFKNTNMKPLKHATYLRLQALREHFWHVDDKLMALASMSLKNLISFIPRLLSEIHLEVLCHGNLSEEEALDIAKNFKDSLCIKPLSSMFGHKERILKLPPNTSLVHNVNAKNEAEENSVVEMYFQLEQDLGKETVRARAISDLIESIVHEPFFNELRTKEQLGYTVDAGVRLTNRVLGFCFRVQSSKYRPIYLRQRMDAFVANLQNVLKEIGEEEFQHYVEALIAEKLERDHSLIEETDRFWNQIVDRRFIFDINKLEAAELRRINKHDIINWYNDFICLNSPKRRKLTICVWGSTARAQEDTKDASSFPEVSHETETVVQNLLSIKQENEYYSPLC